MSFASEAKKELTSLPVHPEHARAELAALIRMNGSLNIGQGKLLVNVQTENPAIARRIYNLIKDNYKTETDLIVRRKMNLKKNNQYIVKINDQAQEILEDLKIFDTNKIGIQENVATEFSENKQRARSYLRGAFLATGSINDPKTSSYHLEIYSQYEEHNDSIQKMMNEFNLNAKTTVRRSGFIVYIKEAEKISDFLRVIGASNAMLKFEDVRILRDMKNSVNRLVNCENANLNKTIDAANQQILNIQKIETNIGLDKLPEKLAEIAKIRLEYPQITLRELGEKIPGGISKSGINHRLRKINEIAAKL